MKDNKNYYSSYSISDIYWSDLSKAKQKELLAAGIKSTYILDDIIPIAEVDEYYLYEPSYTYKGYKSNNPYKSKQPYKYSYTYKQPDDSNLVLADLTKAARKVYWLISEYFPAEGDLPTDMQIGDIVEYLEQFYSLEELQKLIDSEDKSELQAISDDIIELFFNVDLT